MIPGIALMVGAYCIARLLLTWNKPETDGWEGTYRLLVTVGALLVILAGLWSVFGASLDFSKLAATLESR